MQVRKFDDRFKDAPWYREASNEKIIFVGCGGIGSISIYNLAKSIPATYYIYDNDSVEDINVGTQFFTKDKISKNKAAVMYEQMQNYGCLNIIPFKTKYINEYTPIMISGVDNMAARKEIFRVWKEKEDRELLIDGRMRAMLYEVYVVKKGDEERYEKTLFDDNEVDDGPCTFKQTSFFGSLIGGRITQILSNYLTNKYLRDDICVVPFSIKEIGELLLIKTEE